MERIHDMLIKVWVQQNYDHLDDCYKLGQFSNLYTFLISHVYLL